MFPNFASVISALGRPSEVSHGLQAIDERYRAETGARIAELRRRDYLPPSLWPAIERLAKERGIEVSRDDLCRILIEREARSRGWETAEVPEAEAA